jgi:hypothetical protein
MTRRLTLRSETLAELATDDLSAVNGAAGPAVTGATCWQSVNCTQITVPTGCGLVCDAINAVTDVVRTAVGG